MQIIILAKMEVRSFDMGRSLNESYTNEEYSHNRHNEIPCDSEVQLQRLSTYATNGNRN